MLTFSALKGRLSCLFTSLFSSFIYICLRFTDFLKSKIYRIFIKMCLFFTQKRLPWTKWVHNFGRDLKWCEWRVPSGMAPCWSISEVLMCYEVSLQPSRLEFFPTGEKIHIERWGNDLTAEITVVKFDLLPCPKVCENVMWIKSPLKEKHTHLSDARKKPYDFMCSASHCLDIFWSHVLSYKKAIKTKYFFHRAFFFSFCCCCFVLFLFFFKLIN